MLTKSSFMALALWILAGAAVAESLPPAAQFRLKSGDSTDASRSADVYVAQLPPVKPS